MFKIPAWNQSVVKSEEEVAGEAQAKNTNVHIATLMDLCHIEHSELAEHLQKYKRQSRRSSGTRGANT